MRVPLALVAAALVVAAHAAAAPPASVLGVVRSDAGVLSVARLDPLSLAPVGQAPLAAVRPLAGSFVTAVPTPAGIVALLAPRAGIGRARLALVDTLGRVRSLSLRGVLAGTRVTNRRRYAAHVQHPGLAVDGSGSRADVVPATGPVVEVDLRTL